MARNSLQHRHSKSNPYDLGEGQRSYQQSLNWGSPILLRNTTKETKIKEMEVINGYSIVNKKKDPILVALKAILQLLSSDILKYNT